MNKITVTRSRVIKLLAITVMLIATVFLSITLQSVFEQEAAYHEARTMYRELREAAAADGCGAEEAAEEYVRTVNFDIPLVLNHDMVGWIHLPETAISYPIVQGTDNEYYLSHMFDLSENASGSIFVDYRDCVSFMSRVRIYGHDMRDGSMFGTLDTWQGDTFLIYTPSSVLDVSVTWRGVMSAAEVAALRDSTDIFLITCVRGNRDVRYVVRGEIRH